MELKITGTPDEIKNCSMLLVVAKSSMFKILMGI